MNEQDSGDHMRPDDNLASQPAMSAGAQLAAAREARGWSIEDVAAQLNLAPRQVYAIETDNHAALPGLPITRGFIRAYAKLLKIDAAPLLATLGGQASAPMEPSATRKVVSAPFAESRLPSLGARKRSPLPVVAVVAVLVLGAAGYWVLQNRDLLPAIPGVTSSPAASERAPQSSAETPAAGTPAAPAEGAPAAAPAEPAATAAPVAPVEPSANPAADAPAGNAPAPATSPASAAPASTPSAGAASVPASGQPALPVPAPSASVTSASDASADVLQLTAREETWVEVRRVSGNAIVLSRLLKPGESQTVPVGEPLSVVIGNAGGVDLTLRGSPVALKGGTGNVSKITVK
ncbi:helix-turn-helix domain-containing protein [Noviherbaspirillum aridicola]|uniref:HTH cro/C1-type domain-containing protein n=1 Tax=Noviherbaspirillum aridicola TaxID=2849687 RepID=A0ABQ4Q5W5_9BURK|nr:helix-turn-helix domain-containing protein [Noviherbaspirillum aridicola]GIZ52606.1 hypothetical protein NCCP691_26200 [Noviherbaspirillum aridicola]